jgi:hypothetical protein
MKIALRQCGTVEDFETLLHNLPKPLGVEANFGVIDAYEGAALYETDNFTYLRKTELKPEGTTQSSFFGDFIPGIHRPRRLLWGEYIQENSPVLIFSRPPAPTANPHR